MAGKNITILLAGIVLVGIIAIALLALQSDGGKRVVVVYTSVDQVYSEPIFLDFENETGIRVLAVYDVEATKTTGLVNRLIAEKDRPQADVFWSGEFSQTIVLKNEGILSSYTSPSATDIPSRYKDPENFWTGFGGRARVFLVNTDRLTPGQYPHSVYDMLDQKYPGPSVGIAYPMFGTSATHAAALYSYLGPEQTHAFFTSINNRHVRVVDGNSVVRDMVADGQLAFGLTDTDDACGAVERGSNVTIIIPDQGPGEMGAVVIPNTVALINRSQHAAEGTIFMDYLLDKKRESAMVASGWIQIPSRDLSGAACINSSGIKPIPVSYEETYSALQPAQKDLIEVFIR
jgi:iron(III) transport system substrate-binding protein